MSTASGITDTVVSRMVAARGDQAALTSLIAELTAAIGLTVAITADGDPDTANTLCEVASEGIFRQACLHAGMARMVRGCA